MSESGTEIAAELAVLGSRLARIAQRFAKTRAHSLGLTQPEYRTLRALRRRGPRRMKDLANWQLLSSQTMSQTVDGLVVAGLATRTEDPDDRRHLLIEATTAGLERLASYEAAFVEYLEGALDELDESELSEIAKALGRLNATISAKREAGYFRFRREAVNA
ncbi:MAG: MarR family winged helix-turn-helix transcriptional regulator [Chloroflexi bacterium]|nr:MarR family winged helix-turn-helix transcriptional regulator [Chloroflexota bacterium]MCY3957349.1 MarR family winged helix-turn-helix transcriptional regulator [Chloroflexota bacterium]